jgi:transposase
MPKISLPPEALAQYLAGQPMRSIAIEYQTTPQTVARRLREAGVTLRQEFLAQLTAEEMRARYEAGESAKGIAKDAGVSHQTVQRRLERAGVQLRGREKTPQQRAKQSKARRLQIPEGDLRDLHAQGMSCREMAAALGCNDETVRDRLVELGLDRLPAKARPERNPFWRGGYAVDEQGYILQHQPDHPQAVKGYVRMHRLVMERELGRMLLPGEVVDHRNGDTSDNDPANLRVFPSNADHLRATLTGRKKLPAVQRELLRQEAVRRARQRVAAILADQGTDADPSR